jgi:hypothetical protein
MKNITTWQQALTSSWSQVWTSFLGFLPQVLGAIIVFAIGLILAFWIRKFTIQLLKVVKINHLANSLGVSGYLKKAGVKMNISEVFGLVAEWLIIIVFFLAAVDILGLSAVSQVLTRVLGYIPNIFAAALIFVAGYVVAGVVETVTRGALASIDKKVAKPVGKLSRYFILTVSFFAAIEQLQIARSLINTFFQGLTYTIVLVFGLSIGLGSKDLVAKILNDWYEKMKK